MVIRAWRPTRRWCNRIFLEVGRKELRFIINFGFFFGFALGIPTAILTEYLLTQWWVLPICGVIIGYMTNLARDQDDLRAGRAAAGSGPSPFQGLFLRRQPEVADVYAGIIADDIVTRGQHRRGAAARAALATARAR